MLSDLKRIIDQICRDRGFDKALLIEAIEEAVRSAARKKLGSRRDIEVRYNEEYGEVEIFQFRIVVEEPEDEQMEISLEEALKLDPEVQLGDELGEKMEDITDLGRIAAQSAKQVIIHKMKDAEREVIYEMFKDRVGEVVSGIVQRFERGNMIVNLGRTDAILPKDQQIPKRSFKQGDRIRAYLKEVRQTARDSQLILSRTCDEFLEKLFQMEVPEMAEGIVRVMGVSREPGFRAKIAVSSSESDVDPVGACVGMKGSRVQNVVQELQGERIDIVTWSPDSAKYVYNALAPAHVSMVRVDEEAKSLLVVVPNDQLSLAIGRQGQNVRLASRLLGWRIDVKSEQRYANLENEGYQSLLALEGVDESLADQLFAKGISSTSVLSEKTVEDLTVLRAIDDEFAQALIEEAKANPFNDEPEAEKNGVEDKGSGNGDQPETELSGEKEEEENLKKVDDEESEEDDRSS
ncbi:transcription termination/antitermination protein NusA [Desulfomarina profundi]|uniref:Transcription termination/antitermination protein NusA n=1 Tax=Desulfomarina profundi TaxID=2772557 RepID=A0A8D5FTR6_9BACT|nr:transcription termination factor NusA [Desulfomarina profundi]BCL61226.1 transcription termination/antitermination protein NusA [Desulfomarina profundi]